MVDLCYHPVEDLELALEVGHHLLILRGQLDLPDMLVTGVIAIQDANNALHHLLRVLDLIILVLALGPHPGHSLIEVLSSYRHAVLLCLLLIFHLSYYC